MPVRTVRFDARTNAVLLIEQRLVPRRDFRVSAGCQSEPGR